MRFSKSLKKAVKKHNSAGAFGAKVEIRENVLRFVGAREARVFDAFAGAGELHGEVWRLAAYYEGCDKTLYLKDKRTLFCADNRRVLRCIDLGLFNIFDLDAFGSPWEQAGIIAARRPVRKGEKIGLVLTLGEGINLKMGGMPAALGRLAGFTMGVPGALRDGEIADRAIRGIAQRMDCEIAHRWQAEKKGASQMRYIGLALKGV